MENYKKTLIHKFKDVKNEIRYILYKWKKENTKNTFRNFKNFRKKLNNQVYFTETSPGIFESEKNSNSNRPILLSKNIMRLTNFVSELEIG